MKISGLAKWGAAGGIFLLALALLGPLFLPDPTATVDLARQLNAPSSTDWFGRNHHGQDLFSLVIWGARTSLAVGLIVVMGSFAIGTSLGLAAGYFGGRVDSVISRLVEIVLAFPGILLATAIAAVLGPSLVTVTVALCAGGWVVFARLARAQVLSLKEREFVLAAKALGVRRRRIVGRHLLPNAMGPLVAQATLSMANAILGESSLSFLGIGVPSGRPSWGTAAGDGARYLLQAPHMAFFPGAAILLAVLVFHLLGNGLRSRSDARL